jgi:hypothetical protein
MKEYSSFSVEDIRKLRTKESKKLLKMTTEEMIDYIRRGAERVEKEIQEIRENRLCTEGADQAKEA